ncbi:MAG: amidohydrolase family protein [Bacteroidota bacterium]
MKKIDAHQHFWQFDPVRDSWITDDMFVIQQDFLPEHLAPLLAENDFEGCVVVQSDQSEAENLFQLKNAAENKFVKGVVGWIDLRADDIEEKLSWYSKFEKLKGFRHVLQGEAQRDLMLEPSFMHGIGLLHQFGFTYDILIFPDQLPYVPSLAAAFPQQQFVIDHIAKPAIAAGEIANWKKNIEAVAKYTNVSCKVSGMVTEANWANWKQEDFTPYLDTITQAFGEDRIMFGSDWPVCLVAASYKQVIKIAADYFSQFSSEVQNKFFNLNASRFYKL